MPNTANTTRKKKKQVQFRNQTNSKGFFLRNLQGHRGKLMAGIQSTKKKPYTNRPFAAADQNEFNLMNEFAAKKYRIFNTQFLTPQTTPHPKLNQRLSQIFANLSSKYNTHADLTAAIRKLKGRSAKDIEKLVGRATELYPPPPPPKILAEARPKGKFWNSNSNNE